MVLAMFLLLVTTIWKPIGSTETLQNICNHFLNREEWMSQRQDFFKRLIASGLKKEVDYQYLLNSTTMARLCKPVIANSVNKENSKVQRQWNSELSSLNRCIGLSSNFWTFVGDFIDHFHLRGATLIHNNMKGVSLYSFQKLFNQRNLLYFNILAKEQVLPIICMARMHNIPFSVASQNWEIKPAQRLVVYILQSELKRLTINLGHVRSLSRNLIPQLDIFTYFFVAF